MRTVPLLLGSIVLLAGCGAGQAPTPQTVEVTRIVVQTQLVVVTATPEPATPTPEPTATPEANVQLELGSYSTYRNSIGRLIFVGEVLNKGTTPAENVQIAISMLNAEGGVVGTASTNIVELRVAKPGEPYPFKMSVDEVPGDLAKVDIQVVGEPQRNIPIFAPYLALEASGVADGLTGLAGGFQVNGTINNTGDKTAELVHIAVVCYNAEGKVIEVMDGYASLDKIPAGGSAPFSVDSLQLKESPASYKVLVQGGEASN